MRLTSSRPTHLAKKVPNVRVVRVFGEVGDIQGGLPCEVHSNFLFVDSFLVLGQRCRYAILKQTFRHVRLQGLASLTLSANSTVAT